VNSAETIERVPIHTDADGVVRVAGTRVTLDTIVAAFDAGATAEEIAQQYSSISLADVYTGTSDSPAPIRNAPSMLRLAADETGAYGSHQGAQRRFSAFRV